MRTPPLQVGAGNFTVSFHAGRDGGRNYDGDSWGSRRTSSATWTNVNSVAVNWQHHQWRQRLARPGRAALHGTESATACHGHHHRQPGRGLCGGRPCAWPGDAHQSNFAAEGWEVDDIVITSIRQRPFPRVVTDRQACAPGLVAFDGTPQSASVNTAQLHTARSPLQLRGVAGAPQVGESGWQPP